MSRSNTRTAAPPLLASSLLGRRVEVRWSAMVADGDAGPRALELVVTVHVIDPHHPLLEAWLQTPDGTKTIVPRQPVAAHLSEDGLLHLDAVHRTRRVLALSMRLGDAPELIYAQTALFEDAGFRPGAHDPPRITLRGPESDVVSA